MTTKNTSIAIIGAGISGLSLAFFLKQNYPHIDLKIFEKKSISGGFIQPKENGFEKGPHIFKSSRSQALLELIDKLHLVDKVVYSNENAAKRYIFRKGKLQKIPHSFVSFVSSFFFPLAIDAFIKDLLAKKVDEDESVYSFCLRRFGKKMTETVFDPLAIGIWAGNIQELSIESCFPLLKEYERKYGSVVRGFIKNRKKEKTDPRLFTLKEGMHQLIESLIFSLKEEVISNTEVEAISYKESGINIRASGKEYIFDKVIVALPSKDASHLLKPLDNALAKSVESIPTKGVNVVNLSFKKQPFMLKGFGYLIPSYENKAVLGSIFDSQMFAGDEDIEYLTVMMKSEEKDPLQGALLAVRDHLGITDSPLDFRITPWNEAIPQYEVNHKLKIEGIKKELKGSYPNLFLIGNYLSGVSVNDCVAQAKALAEIIL